MPSSPQKRRRASQLLKAARAAAGLCAICTAALDRPAQTCTGCGEMQAENRRRRYARRRAAGLCEACGEPAEATYCDGCAEHRNALRRERGTR